MTGATLDFVMMGGTLLVNTRKSPNFGRDPPNGVRTRFRKSKDQCPTLRWGTGLLMADRVGLISLRSISHARFESNGARTRFRKSKDQCPALLGHWSFDGGQSGIRTHGRLPYTRFPSVLLKPLRHLSIVEILRVAKMLASEAFARKKSSLNTIPQSGIDFASRRLSRLAESSSRLEPTVGCPTHAFQACSLNRSDICPLLKSCGSLRCWHLKLSQEKRVR
jgi:hypothetical protein